MNPSVAGGTSNIRSLIHFNSDQLSAGIWYKIWITTNCLGSYSVPIDQQNLVLSIRPLINPQSMAVPLMLALDIWYQIISDAKFRLLPYHYLRKCKYFINYLIIYCYFLA